MPWGTLGSSAGRLGVYAEDPLLDGRSEPDRVALAELGRERASAGARWLADLARDDGSFLYIYYPEDDEYDREDYNEVRHAGTTYSLFTAYSVAGDEAVLEAAEGGVRTSIARPSRQKASRGAPTSTASG